MNGPGRTVCGLYGDAPRIRVRNSGHSSSPDLVGRCRRVHPGAAAWFTPLVDPANLDGPGHQPGSIGWHLSWLMGLDMLGTAVTLLRDGGRRLAAALGIGVLPLTSCPTFGF
jgi:hypothetical protein